MFRALVAIFISAQAVVLVPCYGEGEVTYEDCETVAAKFLYDKQEKYCEVMARCTKCVSGFRLACDTIATVPFWCKANGNRCPSAPACLYDKSLDMKVVKRLTETPTTDPCGKPSFHENGAAR